MVLDLRVEGDLVRAIVTSDQTPDLPVLAGLDVVVRADATAALENPVATQEDP